jgi:hypothetical protein
MRRIGAFIGTFMTAGLAMQGQAASVVTNIEGSLGQAENTCVQPIALFAFKNCNFAGGALVATELGLDAAAIGPLDSGGFYPDAASAPPFELSTEPGVDDDGVPLNTYMVNNGSSFDDGKIAPLLTGTITIDDGGDGFGDTNDTIAGTLVIGPAARLAPVSGNLAGQSAIVEEWTSITHTLPATLVSSATPNGFGGFDYVLGSDGFPDNIRTGTRGNPIGVGDFFASEVAANDANDPVDSPWMVVNGGTGLNWDGVTGTDITRYGLGFTGPGPNPGGATTAVIAGLDCFDTGLEPKVPGEPKDTMTACQDSSIGWSITPTTGTGAGKLGAGFDNLVMKLSTNGANEVVVADAYYTTEYPIIQVNDNSWIGTTLRFVQEFEAVDDNATILARAPVPVDIDVLANDTNFIDDVTVTRTAPANGTATIMGSPGPQAGIVIRYTPNASLVPVPPATSVDDIFTYTVTDSNGSSDMATVTVAVTNLIPVAVNDATAVSPSGMVNIPVLGNDIPAGDLPTKDVTKVTDPALGSVVKQPDLSFTYTSTGAIGEDSFTYTLTDFNDDVSNAATVTVTICPVGTICAVDDIGATTPVTAVTIFPLVNDAGLALATPDFTVMNVTDPTNGTIGPIVSPCTDPAVCSITYTPNAGFGRGNTDTFDYEVQDSAGTPLMDTATVTITVNDVPFANPDMAATNVNTSVPIDVLGNDTGLSDTPLQVNIESGPSFGTANVVDTGGGTPASIRVQYANDGTPEPDMFTYTVTDDNGDVSNAATVTIAVNDVPDAQNDVADVEPSNSVDIPVLLNDSGLSDIPLMLTVANPANGSISQTGCNEQDTCVVTYTSSGATGVDTFDYTVTDNDDDSDTATVSVTVADPSTPIAVDDVAQTSRNQDVKIDVLTNDGGLVDLPITVELITPARNGRLTVNGSPGDPQNISITYAPGISFFGSDSFIYQVTDDDGQFDQATVRITVVNDQVGITLPSDDGSALGPWSLALLGALIWLRGRRRR